MATKRVESWVVTDDFWARVEPLIPPRVAVARKTYARKPGAGRPPKPARQVFEAVVFVLHEGANESLPKERFRQRCTSGSPSGRRRASSKRCGRPAWPSTTRWKGSPGDGRASMEQCSRHRWHKNLSGPTRRIGEKNGSKRHLLVDGRSVPLSIVVTAANVNDSKRLEQVLKAIAVRRPMPTERRSKHLCADAGYRGAELRRIIEWHGYIPTRCGSSPGGEREEKAPRQEGPSLGRRGLPRL